MAPVSHDYLPPEALERAAGRRKIDRQRRSDLLGQIEQILLQEGFAELSMDELATRLRCSKSTLYAVAGSKNDLVSMVVKRFFEGATARIEAETAAESDYRRKVKVYLHGVGR